MVGATTILIHTAILVTDTGMDMGTVTGTAADTTNAAAIDATAESVIAIAAAGMIDRIQLQDRQHTHRRRRRRDLKRMSSDRAVRLVPPSTADIVLYRRESAEKVERARLTLVLPACTYPEIVAFVISSRID
jgi:hypothetical protein